MQPWFFSFVGMKTQEVAIGNKTTINITLIEDAINLEEVVAVGYGTVRKSDLTSAIAKVSGDELASRPVTRVDQALQGQMAGVQVQQSGGKPGKNATIHVRGVGSITAGNDPLYVVDGFPVDAEVFANTNLDNIESIEVLKDAASASIYGSRGSNGVIIVTTKRGVKGTELRLNFNAYTGIANIEREVKMLNSQQYMSFVKEARDDNYFKNGGDPNVLPINRSLTYRYDQNWVNNPDIPTYDMQAAILHTGKTQSYQFSASGSTEKSRYMISGEYYDQTGIVKNTDFTRYSFRSNVDVDVNKFLTIGLNLAPYYSITDDKDVEGKGGIIDAVLSSGPLFDPRTGYWGESDPFTAWNSSAGIAGSLALIENLKDKLTRAQILSNVYAQVTFIPGLTFKTSFGANYYNTRRDRFQNQVIVRTGKPQGENWVAQDINWLNENVLNYNKTFNSKHNLGLLLGFTSQKEQYKSSYINGTGFANDLVPTLNAATTWTANTSMSEWSLLSYLGRLNYSFADKYMFSASIRTDGSSRFGANTKWGQFPSVSAGWRIDQENFIKSIDHISRLKLRASWGKTGNNNIGNYGSIATLGSSAYLFGTSEIITPGLSPNQISNPNLGWEKKTTSDIGIDLGVFKNRVTLAVDYYSSQTSDLLLNVPVSAVTGFTSAIQNIGKVENKGWEFELVSANLEGKLKWTTNLNLSLNKNKVIQLGPNNAPIVSGDWWDNQNITMVGYPIGSFYMYKQLGIYNTQAEIDASPHAAGTQPGDVIVEDYNKDGKIDSNDRQVLGSNIPTYYMGLTNQFKYKGFDLSFMFNFVGGNEIFDSQGRAHDQPNNSHVAHYAQWTNRWESPENPGNGFTPRATDKPTGLSNQYTSRFLYSGNYVRFKNLTLGYTFPKQLIQKLKLYELHVYVQGENLHIWDHYVGYTPEVDLSNGIATVAGRDYGTYPSSRTFLFGLNVSF